MAKAKASSSKLGILIALCVLVAGCSVLPDVTETAVPTVTATPAPAAPTATRIPSATPRPSATPTRTALPTVSPTPKWTPGPRLSPEELEAVFGELLATNGGCALPCWWGITPGETTWDEMRAFFNERGIWITTRKNGLSAVFKLDKAYPAWGYGGIGFLGQHGLVHTIQVTGSAVKEPSAQNTSLFAPNEYLAQFSLPRVLSTYGAPSRIYVSGYGTTSHSNTAGCYDLWMEYADQGILLRYAGYTVGNYTEYLICPAGGGVDEIELWLQPPGTTLSDTMKIAGSAFYDEQRLEELEPVVVEEFHAAFRQSEFSGCLRMPAEHEHESVRPADLSPVLSSAADAPLVEMLETNGGCELPCWWGITPGVTTIQDAQQVFLSLGKPIGVIKWYYSGQIQHETKPFTLYGQRYQPSSRTRQRIQHEVEPFIRHGSASLDYVTRQSFFAEGDLVSYISVSGEPPAWVSHSQHLAQDWQRYSLASILARFGPPSRVELFYHHPSCGETYRLQVAYDDLGILIWYSGVVQREAGTVTICPGTDDVISIDMTLATPAYFTGAGSDLRGWNPEIDANVFYQTYVNPNAPICMELPEQSEYTCE